MKLLVHIPSRERPDKLWEAVKSFMVQAEGKVHLLLSLDNGDEAMERAAERFRLPRVTVRWGDRVSKIEAFNRDVSRASWEVLVSASDDMRAVVRGYDTRILEAVKAYGPDVALWCDDGRQQRLCTIPVMDRVYYDRDGQVFNPVYDSFFADDEWHEKAQMRGRLERLPGPMFRHDQYQFVYAGNDPLYRHNERFKAKDRRTYFSRRADSFP